MIALELHWPAPIDLNAVLACKPAVHVPTPEEIAEDKKRKKAAATARFYARAKLGESAPMVIARQQRYVAILELLNNCNSRGLTASQVSYRLTNKKTTNKTDMRNMALKGMLRFDEATGKYYAV